MKVLVTGGSGFVGRAVVERLVEQGHTPRVLVRNPQSLNDLPGIETITGDITRPETFSAQLQGLDAVIHLVGIIREYPGRGITFDKLHRQATENVLKAATDAGIKRYLQMSANGTRAEALTAYHQTKWAAEELVRKSALEWTIFRPSLIHGPRDMFVNLLARLVKLLPVVPVMGDGQYRLQPVHVEDVATGFVAALDHSDTIGEHFSCCGPESHSYDQILDLIGQALGRRRIIKLHQPLALMKPLVGTLQHIPLFPMTSDQLQMLLEGNVCCDRRWAETFALQPKEFAASIRDYL